MLQCAPKLEEVPVKFNISTRKSKNAEGVWVAKCPDLGIVTQGTSPGEAREALKEAAGFLLVGSISTSARSLTIPSVAGDVANAAGHRHATA